jgi:hypothetical protein
MGFYPNRPPMDNRIIIRQLLEKCYEHNIDLHNVSVDNTQAFEYVYRYKTIEC